MTESSPKTAKIEVRVTPELKAAAIAKAKAKDTTVSERVTSWLEQWTAQG